MTNNIIKFPTPKVGPWIEEGFELISEGYVDDEGQIYYAKKEAQLIEDMHND